jgi:hypothetical protein
LIIVLTFGLLLLLLVPVSVGRFAVVIGITQLHILERLFFLFLLLIPFLLLALLLFLCHWEILSQRLRYLLKFFLSLTLIL